MADDASIEGSDGLLAKPETLTREYMLRLLRHYYAQKWNTNSDVLKTLRKWRDWRIVVRMPDLSADFTVLIEEGKVVEVNAGTPSEARLLVVMLADTQRRIYYDETTAAIESLAGRIKFRGNETERRRMMAAVSYLTW